MPDRFWQTEYIDTISRYQGKIILEGPFPQGLEKFLGARKIGDTVFPYGVIKIKSEKMRSYIDAMNNGLESGIRIVPKSFMMKTSKIPEARWDINYVSFEDIQSILLCTVKSFAHIFKNRFYRYQNLFQFESYNLIGLLFIAEYIEANISNDLFSNNSIRSIFEITTNKYLFHEKRPSPQFIRSLFRTEDFFPKLSLSSPGRTMRIMKSQLSDLLQGRLNNSDKLVAMWLTSESYDKGGEKEDSEHQIFKNFKKIIKKNFNHVQNGSLKLKQQAFSSLRQSIYKSIGIDTNNAQDMAILSMIFLNIDENKTAGVIIDLMLEVCLDKEKGYFFNCQVKPDGVYALNKYSQVPWIALSLLRYYKRIRSAQKSSEKIDSHSEDIVKKNWKNEPYEVFNYYCDTAEEYGTLLKQEKEVCAAFFENNNVIGFGFQIFSTIVYAHTMHSLNESLYSYNTMPAINLELILFYLLKKKCNEFNIGPPIIANWPWDKKYCLNIRHDVDRIPDNSMINRLHEFEHNNDLGVNWFWLPWRLDQKLMQKQIEIGHEVGLHSYKIDKKNEEKNKIENALSDLEYTVRGEAIHGAHGSDGWLGYSTVDAALKAKMLYTDFPGSTYIMPYFFPVLSKSGVEVCDIMVFPVTLSLDSQAFDENFDEISAMNSDSMICKWTNFHLRYEGFIQLLNHPDMNFERLENMIKILPDNRVDWTCRQVYEWLNKTHRHKNLSWSLLKSTESCKIYQIKSAYCIDELEIRFPISTNKIDAALNDNGITKTPEQGFIHDDISDNQYFRVKLDLKKNKPVQLVVNFVNP
jgi:hypothetical protein